MADEIELVLRAAKGDSAACGLLTEPCRPWLYGICFRLMQDRATAEDLAQETLLLAFRDIAQLREPERFRGWLSRIAINACRMYLRRQLTRPEELPELDEAAPAQEDSTEPPLAVDSALARLDAMNRRILLLYYDEGLDYSELADALALSSAAVKSRLHRAREKLRKEMLAMMNDKQKERLGVGEEQPWKLHTILLVEPDLEVCNEIREALTAEGYEVVALPSGEAALEAVKQKRGQMMILDKNCVEPHWLEVMTLIQVDAWSRENVPVCVLADGGGQRERDMTLAWQAGAALFLTKPFDKNELAGFVARIGKDWMKEITPK